ncbi:MAG: MotA/TolQ/ExbB proton channel family protein [Candidatus Omnitrophica bacterium]|nr:MotA/TolQ/ExbB proton channel family protein [Candidatus Omnitrophota bacterium]
MGSIIGWALVLERLWVFRKMSTLNSYEFVQEIFRNIKSRDIKSAMQLCEENIKHPIAAVFKVGIERRLLPMDRLEKILEQVGNNQVERLEKFLGVIASVISIEPLLGFLGTITGLIKAFMSWEHAGADITVNVLAGGIYEAMITTAAGLIIAIPLYLFYNYLINCIKRISNSLNNHTIQLIELFSETNESTR